MVVAGVAGVAVGMTFAAWWSMRRTMFAVGVSTMGLAVLVGLAVTLLLAGAVTAFVVVPVSALVGISLAGRDDRGGGAADDEPPWWPSFERDLRDYERTRSRPIRPRSRPRG